MKQLSGFSKKILISVSGFVLLLIFIIAAYRIFSFPAWAQSNISPEWTVEDAGPYGQIMLYVVGAPPGRPIACHNVTFTSERTVGGLLRFGHARALIPHCGIIHYPRAASLRLSLQLNIDIIKFGGAPINNMDTPPIIF